MSKPKTKIENEEKDARFRRVVEPRILKMLYQINRITEMTKSQVYKIYDTDAQKIIEKTRPILENFLTTFTNIAENKKIEEEEVIEKIF